MQAREIANETERSSAYLRDFPLRLPPPLLTLSLTLYPRATLFPFYSSYHAFSTSPPALHFPLFLLRLSSILTRLSLPPLSSVFLSRNFPPLSASFPDTPIVTPT